MTNNLITLTIPNDDSVALFHLGKSLIGMSSTIDGCPDWVILSSEQYDALTRHEEPVDNKPGGLIRGKIDTVERIDNVKQLIRDDFVPYPEVGTTAQQVESLVKPYSGQPVKPDDSVIGNVSDTTLRNETVTASVEITSPTAIAMITGSDKTGTPWDERIHSTSKALNADGSWRLRRKPKDMDEAMWLKYIESVKNNTTDDNDDSWDTDRRPGSGGEGGVGVGEFDEPPVTPPGDDFHTDADVVTEQTVAGIPPLPVPPPVVVAPPVPEVTTWDFPRLMTFLTERHGKIDVAMVNMLLAQDGMSSVQELNAHPDKIGPFVARVKAHLGE